MLYPLSATRKYLDFDAFFMFHLSPHDIAQSKQHKSIAASDVLKALETIEFSDMVNKLQGELVSVSSTPDPIPIHSTVEHNLLFCFCFVD